MTLDLTTHFLARGKPGSPLDAHVELVRQTRGHAFLQGVVQAERRELLQLQRHAEAHPRAQRAGMTGPVRAAYDRAGSRRRAETRRARRNAPSPRWTDSPQTRGPSGILSRLFGSKGDGPAGVYLWGGVGRGKSMLMDLAFDHIAVAPKRRVHFHEFMIETHARLRKARESEEGDPIEPVAEEIAGGGQAARFRRDAGHQSRRRDDPVAAVREIARAGRQGRHHLQPPAARPLQGRPQPRAVHALHRS